MWLLNNPNPHNRNYYSSRWMCRHGILPSRLPHLVVVHTSEQLPDYHPPDAGAESLAAYVSTTTRRVSWHAHVDSDSRVLVLPPSYVAFHVRRYNSCSVGLEIATRASEWSRKPSWWIDGALWQAGKVCADWSDAFEIPTVRLTRAQADRGARGYISHAALDPGRRTDPGADFPWLKFLTTTHVLRGGPMPWTKPGDPVKDVEDAKAVNAYQGGSVWTPHDIDYDENDPALLDERYKVITSRLVDLMMLLDLRKADR